jgi:hypothetical protein
MAKKIIAATELAEFVYCSKAWQLKFIQRIASSPEARELQAQGREWHVAQGRTLARGDSYRWAAYVALGLGVVLFVFCWLGWTR